jgi:hypothetical protein
MALRPPESTPIRHSLLLHSRSTGLKSVGTFQIVIAALFTGTAVFFPLAAGAGSCCGGSGGASLVLPNYYQSMIDVSFEFEKYRGFWNQNGTVTADPPGSDLRQYRLNIGYARRIASRWQTSVMVPYVWNDNTYSGLSSNTRGIGDTTLNVWYEAVDDNSSWKIRSLKDMIPSITIGADLLVPTGISPYDDVSSSFDITGRGFYRLDGNIIVAKTLNPWSTSLSVSYGTYIERSVNREYGKYVEPYQKKLGDRASGSFSLSYIYYIGTGGDKLTVTGSFSYLREADTTYNGSRDVNSGFRKESVGASLAYASTDHDWSARVSWNHAVRQDGWGDNFPITDIYTVGVSYGFR